MEKPKNFSRTSPLGMKVVKLDFVSEAEFWQLIDEGVSESDAEAEESEMDSVLLTILTLVHRFGSLIT